MDDPAALSAQDAADALIILGWPVLPEGDDMERWRIGDFVLSDSELIAFAASKGIVVPSGPMQ